MKQEIYNTLDRLGIDYTRLEHPSIMTMEEGMTIAQKLGVSPCKNLFLVNKQKEYFLLLLSGNKKLSAKSIAKQIGSSHLSFASDEDMKTLLFTTPGAVSILGLIYDRENKVKLLIDKDVIQADYENDKMIFCDSLLSQFLLKFNQLRISLFPMELTKSP